MKKTKKITCGVLSLLCASAIGAGILSLPVTAENKTISNKDFFTVKGATMSASETADGLKLSLSNVSKQATNRDVASIYYNNLIDVSDLAKGITLLNSSATATREFDFMSIILRDSEDPTQVMSLHLQYAAWAGSGIETASLGLWDEFSYASTGKQSYVYDGEMTSGAAATREWMAYADGRYVYQNGSDGCLRLGNPAKILWGKDGEVVPFTFTYSNSVMKISSHNRTVADLTDAKYFEKAIANVSESEQPDLYDNLNEEYAANLFLSNKVTMELQFGNVKDGEFDICVQKIGGLNLQPGVENNYQSTSSSGVTYTGTALPITSEMIKLPGKYSAEDIQKGVMFHVLPSVISTSAAGHVRVIIRDSEDPTKAITAGLASTDWYGSRMNVSLYKVGVWDRTSDKVWTDGTTNYSVSASVNDFNASANNELGVLDFGANTPHGFFRADGTNKTATSAIKVAYNGTTLSCNGRSTAGTVTTETILTSGYATVEIQFGVAGTSYTLNGKVNLISVGDTSLANIGSADSLVDNMKPVINSGASFDVEAGKSYTMDEIKAFATASDNIGVSEFTAVVYNKDGVAYEGENFTFVANAGDYIVYTAKDAQGLTATKTVNVVAAKSYTITMVVAGVESTQSVVESESFTFAPATVEGKVFVGWEIGGKLYPATYAIEAVSEDVTATAVAIEFNMVVGASIRIESGKPGIRWAATLGDGDKDALGDYATEWGVKVTSESKAGFLAIPATKWVNDGSTEFRCAMTDMDASVEEGLYDIEFEGRAYVRITYEDGSKATIWAIANDNVRSISQVALNIYDQVSPEMQAILDEFITVSGNS